MMRTTAGAAILVLTLVGGLTAEDTASDRMFNRMTTLAGRWEGTLEWSGARTGTGTLEARYEVAAAGSALVETLIMSGVPSMTTVYHLDGADLRMTHYCAARNQPRLKSSAIDEAGGGVRFSFVDVTNVGARNPGYVEGFEIRLLDADHINIRFTFGGGAKQAVENIDLHRVRAAATAKK